MPDALALVHESELKSGSNNRHLDRKVNLLVLLSICAFEGPEIRDIHRLLRLD